MHITLTVILFAHLLLSGTCYLLDIKDDEPIEMDNSTVQVAIIRRPPPSRISVGGSRLSLLNTRYNRRPKKKNMDPSHLAEILGDFYDPNWMSVDTPSELAKDNKGVMYLVQPDAWPYKELLKALRGMNLTLELSEGLSLTQIAALERWFIKKASCPVKYAWEDVGPMFWPRWIKRGTCADVSGSCSWPPGMHCVEIARSTLQVLRWQCRIPKNRSRRKTTYKKREWRKRHEIDQASYHLRCQWIQVPYPITSACRCTC